MEQSKQEKDLKKLKVTIKTWESEFAKSNQRKPSQDDIQAASPEIKDAYKSYWLLKKKIESKNINKEDVWSEKLNKPCNRNLKIQTSDAIFIKFCNKIKERSTDVKSQTRIEECIQKENMLEEHINSEKTGSYLSEQSLCDTLNGNNAKDLNNLEEDVQEILKPTKKIVKSNSVSRKVKPVNILSSSVDFKNHKNSLCFETNIDNEWLERCNDDKLNSSCNSGILVNNAYVSKRSVSHTSGEFSVEIEKDDKEKSCSSPKNLGASVVEFCQTNSDQYPDVSSLNIISNVHIPNGDQESKCLPCHSNVDTNIIEYPMCVSDVNWIDLQSPTKNKVESNNEEVRVCVEKKLTKTYAVNPKLSNHLERKMASGTLNENFRKINIKKKKFSRGHKIVNVRKLKWQKWKELKKYGSSDASMSSSTSCFKCGQAGHWARNCKVLTKKSEEPETVEDFDDVPLPTLEEVAELARKSKSDVLNSEARNISKSTEISSNEISFNMPVTQDNHEYTGSNTSEKIIKPLYEPTAEGNLIGTPSEVFDTLNELGYSDFRKGQETAIMRILSGLSTLVVLPTGSGKSLCYQLPAYMYAKRYCCIAIVISPLVSLMEDQVTGLPSCLHAVCLNSGMSDVQKKSSVQDLKDGKAQILLVSPEAVVGGLFYGSGILPSDMPPISFACIDEAHCISQWSHNFRPSYLQLYKVLTQRLNVRCILGLTATANHSTALDIVSRLGFKSIEETVIGSTGIPKNLHLSVSRDKDRDRALIQLLTGDRFNNCNSIIIYCIRRDETERLATLIRTCLQDQIADEQPAKKLKSKSKKRNFKWTAEAYHAGLAPPRRRSIQKQFMSGKLRVVVATTAFGMGLDKRDVRAVIHFNMPKSFESYVQEIGRAGRDGLDSHCHLFLDNEGKDLQELKRFIYMNSTDRYIIRKLLKKVFVPCQCEKPAVELNQTSQNVSDSPFQTTCPKHEIAFSIDDTIQELDMKEENVSTLLCYLELHPKKWIELLSPTYAICKIRCYGGPKQLRALVSKSPAVAAALALDAKRGKKLENVSTYEFAIIEVASVMNWSTAAVKRALKNLEWNGMKQKTGVIVEFSNLAFHVRAPGNLSADELDEVLDFLHEKVTRSEKEEIFNLKSLHNIFSSFSQLHYWACCDEAPPACSEGIKEAINKYFHEANPENIEDTDSKDTADIDICDVRSQIRDIIFTNNDQNFSGRAIARIFHGIGSPCYPAEVWGRVRKFWRCLLHANFNLLVKLANEELKNAR